MICQSCSQNVATVHLTEIMNKEKKEVHLCEDCAREKGISYKANFSVTELMSQLSSSGASGSGASGAKASSASGSAATAEASSSTSAATACPSCGLTFGEFRSSGRLGCPEDYEHFKRGLVPLLEKIHGATQHVGKIPHAVAGTEETKSRQLSRLRQQLNTAIQKEDYERAASIRDQIKGLEDQEQGKGEDV